MNDTNFYQFLPLFMPKRNKNIAILPSNSIKIMILLLNLFLLLCCECANANNFIVGVGTHVGGQNIGKNITAINKLGLNSLRDDFYWSAVEEKKGNLTIPTKIGDYLKKAITSNIKPLVILDYGNKHYDRGAKPVSLDGNYAFSRFASFIAHHLKSKPLLFEIWNEWDNSSEPTSAESYFTLVKFATSAIKQSNNTAIILAGSATSTAMRKGWVEKLIHLGIMNYVDGISIHPYVHCSRDASPEAWIDFVLKFSSKLQSINDGKPVPLYITEMGWPSHTGACGLPQEKVAQYLARTLLLVRTCPEIKGIWWYDLKNDGNNIADREHNFGLLNYDYTPKPAAQYMRDIAPIVLKGYHFKRISRKDGLVIIEISGTQGKKSFALWSKDDETKVTLHVDLAQGRTGRFKKIGSGKYSIISTTQNKTIIIDGTPIIFEGIKGLNLH